MIALLDTVGVASLNTLNTETHLLLSSHGTFGVLKRVRHKSITEQLVHLLESPTLGLGEEKDVGQKGNDVEDEEDVEVSELNRGESSRGELGEDEVDGPVGEGSDGVAERTNFDRENLSWVHPGDNTERSVEEGEDKVHGDHGTELRSSGSIEVLAHDSIGKKSGGETSC